MTKRVLQYLGWLVVVIALYATYRYFTDDYITNLFWRGFFAATFLGVCWEFKREFIDK